MKRLLPLVLILVAGCKPPCMLCGVEENKMAYVANPANHCKPDADHPNTRVWSSMMGRVENWPYTSWYCQDLGYMEIDYEDGKPWRP